MSRMKMIILLMLLLCITHANAQTNFSTLDSLLHYATKNSINLQADHIRLQKSKEAKLAAILSIVDVAGNASFSFTNNTRLPVNLFPAEAFGGQPGTYKEVQTGVQYVSNLNENIDIKLVNLKGWQNLKLAKLNIASTTSDNLLNVKTLHENIANAYYNIVNLQEQFVSTKQNLEAANTLLQLSENKYKQGLIKQQDVNDAKVNVINTKESAHQIAHLITQQYLSLKILCDIPSADSIVINEAIRMNEEAGFLEVRMNNLLVNNAQLKEKVGYVNFKQNKASLYPTLSFFQAFTTQQFNTQAKLFDSRLSWIPSNYVGLRLSIPIPNSNTITQIANAKFDYQLAQKNVEQLKIKSSLQHQQLSVDYVKAASQVSAHAAIDALQKDTYQRNINLYKEGLLSLDQTLDSYNAMVNSHYQFIASTINVLLAKAKIDINNKIQ